MSCKRILAQWKGQVINGLWKDGRFLELEPARRSENGIRLNQIRVARVKNIVKNINAAFLDLGNGVMGYYDLDELSAGETPVREETDLVVQVCAEAVKTKALKLTRKFTMSGKYLVLAWNSGGLRFSGKIRDEQWKKEIREKLEGLAGEGCGWILRTNAYGVPADKIAEEGKKLKEKLESVLVTSETRSCYSLLYNPPEEWICSVRDTYGLEEILTDSEECLKALKEYFEEYEPGALEKLRFYEEDGLTLSGCYRLGTAVEEALSERVWLKSGAYLVIQPTEALTVIDVNTGRAIRGKKAGEETFRAINQEAAAEIARQLRLRNLSGIILADFINMNTESYKEELLQYLRRLLREDPVQAKAVDMTKLDLVEMTRKKVKKPLAELINVPSEI